MFDREYRIYYFIPFSTIIAVAILCICLVIIAPFLIYHWALLFLSLCVKRQYLYLFLYAFLPFGIVGFVRSRNLIFGLVSLLPGIETMVAIKVIGQKLVSFSDDVNYIYLNKSFIILTILFLVNCIVKCLVSIIMNFNMAKKASLNRADGCLLKTSYLVTPTLILTLLSIIIDLIFGLLVFSLL